MKKILASVLCLMLALFMLVGCGENVIGEYQENYDPPKEKEVLTYNLYIICEEGTSDDAKTVVNRRIADYVEKSAMRTVLNVVFCTAAEYDSLIKTAMDANTSYNSNAALTAAQKDGKIPQADIVLVTSVEMMDELVAGNKVADLTKFISSDYEYGKFNAQIASSLLNAALINGKYYAIPNNYVVGDYTYLSVDINAAAKYSYLSELDLQSKPGVFGTEYFWLLAAQNGIPDPGALIEEIENSQLNHPDLIRYANKYFVNSTNKEDGTTEYNYFFINTDTATEHGVDCTNVQNYSMARELYHPSINKQSIISSTELFDKIFKELKTSTALSADDCELLKNTTDKYFNRVEVKTEGGATLSNYIFFDKEICDSLGLNNNSYFANCDLLDNTTIIKLWNDISAKGGTPGDYIKLIRGSYDKKAEIEAGDADGRNICNIIEFPSATRADAFSGAFAVNANVTDVERAMEVIYAINNDIILHNYLQYGIADTNYTFANDDKDAGIIERSKEDTTSYIMNPRYTGNVFGLYYCEELGWMPSGVDSAKKQNDESVFKP